MNKEIKKIFLVLILFSLSDGIFYNFQEVWMQQNNLSVQTISIVYSLAALITVSVIFLCSNIIKESKIKRFTCLLLLIKGLFLLLLFFLHATGLNVAIKFLIMFDYALDTEIYACIYPMIALISKNDKIYALRGIVYKFLYYIGVILTTIFIGKSISTFTIGYNLYVLIGAILIFMAYLVLTKVDIEKYYERKDDLDNNILFALFKKLKKDKMEIMYLTSVFVGQTSYYCILGMKIILLINLFSFSDTTSANIILVIGILSGALGYLVLKFLTFKNDYINVSIKYLARGLLYLLAIILNMKVMYLIAFIYPNLTGESYNHIVDAPYINRFSNKYQLAFCNLKEMVSYAGKAVGTLLCGFGIALGIRYIFGFALVFAIIQIVLVYICLYLRLHEKGKKLI